MVLEMMCTVTKDVSLSARIRVLACAFVALLAFSPLCMFGQLYTGSVSGQVTDPTGAVIPHAAVTATDVEKHYVYTVKTDETGRYTFRQLPPSRYTVTVECEGFDKYVREPFSVDVSAAVTVDARLHVKTGTQTVTVTDASAPLLQTRTAALNQEINRKYLNDLPLVGRNGLLLADLSPGVNPPAGQQFGATNPTNFNANGGRNMQSDILMDGVSLTNTENNGGDAMIQYNPPLDTIQEFTVQQGNFSAEYGYTGGAVINAVSRSGTDHYHGELYTFIQNRAFDANSYFNNLNHVPLPPVHWNDAGGTAGGPVWIPKVYNGKNKTYFFVSVDVTHSKNPASETGGVPSAAEKAGDFGEVCGYAGGTFDGQGKCTAPAGQIWDPFSSLVDANGNAILSNDGVSGAQRQNFIPYNNIANYTSPGNPGDPNNPNGTLPQVQGNLIDPVAEKLFAYYPAPNVNVGGSSYNQYLNWYGAGTGHSSARDITVKVDHRLNDDQLLSVKFSKFWSPLGVGNPNLFKNAGDMFTQGEGHGLSYSVTGNYTWTISSKTILAIFLGDTYGYSGNDNLLNSVYKGLDSVKTLGMPGYMNDSGYASFPNNYVQSFLATGSQGWSNFTTGYETRHLLGSLTHVAGNHELKVGGEVRFRFMNMLFNGEPAGVFNFNQSGTAKEEGYGGGDGSGNALATFLMGDNDGWGGYEIPVRPETASKQVGMYVQDNWRVNDRLMLNLGLRYDIETPRTERHNRMSYFDPNAAAPSQIAGVSGAKGAVEYVGADGNGRGIGPVYWGEIQPRFGFAYRLGKDTSVRGGYGIYYEQSMTGLVGLGVSSFNGFSVTTNNVNYYNGNLARPYSFLRNPYPQGILQPLGAQYGAGLYLGSTMTAPIPSWNRIPQEQSWSFDIQHQLPGQILVDVGYVGTKGTHLYGAPSGLDYLSAEGASQFRADPAAALANVPNPYVGSGEPAMVPQWKLWRNYPQYDNSNAVALSGTANPAASSIYHALQIKAQKRYSNGLEFLANYVWSKSIDDASVISSGTSFLGGSSALQDPNNFKGERSLSQFNIPQVFNFAFVYELPFGRGERFGGAMNPWEDMVAGGWHVNATYRLDNGQPLAIGLQNTDPLPTYSQRPQMLGTLKKNSGVNINKYFANPEVIGTPAPYMDGNESRTDPHLRSPGSNTLNASMFKDFPLGFREGARIQFRAEFMNVLNHPVFAAPNTTYGSGTFGIITAQANQSRVGQLGLKVYF